MTLTGHNGPVTSAAYSPDGQRIVTASIDAIAKVWEAQTGQELMTFKGHEAMSIQPPIVLMGSGL